MDLKPSWRCSATKVCLWMWLCCWRWYSEEAGNIHKMAAASKAALQCQPLLVATAAANLSQTEFIMSLAVAATRLRLLLLLLLLLMASLTSGLRHAARAAVATLLYLLYETEFCLSTIECKTSRICYCVDDARLTASGDDGFQTPVQFALMSAISHCLLYLWGCCCCCGRLAIWWHTY